MLKKKISHNFTFKNTECIHLNCVAFQCNTSCRIYSGPQLLEYFKETVKKICKDREVNISVISRYSHVYAAITVDVIEPNFIITPTL